MSDVFAEQGYLQQINLYPVKSLEGIQVKEAEVLADGTLKNDRLFAFFECEKDEWVRAKSYPDLIKLKTSYDLANMTVRVSHESNSIDCDLTQNTDQVALGKWMSDYLQTEVVLKQSEGQGWFDDLKRGRYGCSALGQASLERLINWFPDLSIDEFLRRFRMNLIISDVQAFWEEHIIQEDRSSVVRIGDVILNDPWPCSRCAVSSRDSYNAEFDNSFAKAFTKHREENSAENMGLKTIEKHEKFNGYFTGGIRFDGGSISDKNIIRVGDPVQALANS